MLINAAEGAYTPSYFYMYIDTTEDVTIIENNQSTFAHEYIHFLQDLILPYCIRNNLGTINEFSYVVNMAKQEKKLIRPFDKWEMDQKLVQKQFEYTWGSSHFENQVGKILNITSKHFAMPTGQNVYSYSLEFEHMKYQVGARDFLEYIAHKIEDRYWGANDAPDLPYRIVDKLFEYFGLESIPTEVRVCIVEYCLYNDNPIHMLFSLFLKNNHIKNNLEKFNNLKTCSEYLLNLGWVSRGGFRESIFSKSQRRLNDLSNSLGSQYQHPLLDSVQLWIHSVIEYSRKNFSERFIFSELCNTSLDDFIYKINKIIFDIGIPIIENKKNVFMNLLPEQYKVDHFIQFYILHEFMNFIRSNKEGCPIHDFCVANANCEIDRSFCLSNPFGGLDEEYLCPFKQFIKLYGLGNVKFLCETI